MTPQPNTPQLRPCPMCGENDFSEIWNLHKTVVGHKCQSCLNEFIGTIGRAYCWEEIDRLREQVANLSTRKWERSEKLVEDGRQLGLVEGRVLANEEVMKRMEAYREVAIDLVNRNLIAFRTKPEEVALDYSNEAALTVEAEARRIMEGKA